MEEDIKIAWFMYGAGLLVGGIMLALDQEVARILLIPVGFSIIIFIMISFFFKKKEVRE